MGPAQADRALDDPNLAVRVGYWSSRLLDALQMVPAAGALSAVSSAVLSGLPGATHNFRHALRTSTIQRRAGKSLRCQNLALDGDLMFDQSDEPPRTEETLW